MTDEEKTGFLELIERLTADNAEANKQLVETQQKLTTSKLECASVKARLEDLKTQLERKLNTEVFSIEEADFTRRVLQQTTTKSERLDKLRLESLRKITAIQSRLNDEDLIRAEKMQRETAKIEARNQHIYDRTRNYTLYINPVPAAGGDSPQRRKAEPKKLNLSYAIGKSPEDLLAELGL